MHMFYSCLFACELFFQNVWNKRWLVLEIWPLCPEKTVTVTRNYCYELFFLGGEVMNYCFKNSGASGDTKRHAGNMASMSGVKDNLLHGIQIWD